MKPEEVRAKVHVSAQEFAENFVIIQSPKAIAALWAPHLNDIGLDFQFIDDGEDDGVPVLLIVPRSAALDEPLRHTRRLLILKLALFLLLAAAVVLLSAAHVESAYINTGFGLLCFVALQTTGESVVLGRRRKLRDYLRENGM